MSSSSATPVGTALRQLLSETYGPLMIARNYVDWEDEYRQLRQLGDKQLTRSQINHAFAEGLTRQLRNLHLNEAGSRLRQLSLATDLYCYGAGYRANQGSGEFDSITHDSFSECPTDLDERSCTRGYAKKFRDISSDLPEIVRMVHIPDSIDLSRISRQLSPATATKIVEMSIKSGTFCGPLTVGVDNLTDRPATIDETYYTALNHLQSEIRSLLSPDEIEMITEGMHPDLTVSDVFDPDSRLEFNIPDYSNR